MRTIARPSVASLFIQPEFQGQPLGTATAFCVEYEQRTFLVTNWHVAAGRNPESGVPLSATGGVPDQLKILHNVSDKLGTWVLKTEPLYDSDQQPLWLEHPEHGRNVDVIALQLSELDDVAIHAHDPFTSAVAVAAGVARPLSIVGFPFGLTGGGAFGVWIQGTVATEPQLDFGNLPRFLIDSRTRPGQSGSPVLFYAEGGTVPMADGSTVVYAGPVEQFLGVYSGRINAQSDLGFVWKPDVVRAIVEAASRGTSGAAT
jgi:hypothetical protein